MPPAVVTVVAPTARLAVQEYASQGEPVLLFHGGPGCPDYLAPVAQMLAGTHRPVTFDQRGAGRSVALTPTFGLDDYLADISAIRTYFGFETVHLFGHSWGAVLAQLYARREPKRVRSLFLCNAALGLGEDWRRSERAMVRHALRQSGRLRGIELGLCALALALPGPLPDAAARRLFAAGWRSLFENPRVAFPPPPGWLGGVRGRALVETARSAAAAGAGLLHAVEPPSWPVLVLYGREGYDPFTADAASALARFPAARRVVLRGAGHLPWIQDPEAFRAVLTSFYSA